MMVTGAFSSPRMISGSGPGFIRSSIVGSSAAARDGPKAEAVGRQAAEHRCQRDCAGGDGKFATGDLHLRNSVFCAPTRGVDGPARLDAPALTGSRGYNATLNVAMAEGRRKAWRIAHVCVMAASKPEANP